MNAFHYLLDLIFDFYLILVLVRIWLQAVGADFYNPVSQFAVKATQPVLSPMRRAIPSMGKIDTAGVLLALTISALKWVLLFTLQGQGIDIIITLSLAVVGCIKEVGTLLFWMLIIRAVLSWFSQGYSPFEVVLAQMTEPFMAPIRRVLPAMGGLDLSPMILIIMLNFLNLLVPDLLGSLGQVIDAPYLAQLWRAA